MPTGDAARLGWSSGVGVGTKPYEVVQIDQRIANKMRRFPD